MSVGTNTSGGTHFNSGAFNLPLCHAYTLTGTYIVKTDDGVSHRLFLIKNPWRTDTNFTGKWNDNSPLWTSNVTKQLTAYTKKDDGYIWLEDYEMFVAFVSLYITDLKRGSYSYYSVEGDDNRERYYNFTTTVKQNVTVRLQYYPKRMYSFTCSSATKTSILTIFKGTSTNARISFPVPAGYSASSQLIQLDNLEPGFYSLTVKHTWTQSSSY